MHSIFGEESLIKLKIMKRNKERGKIKPTRDYNKCMLPLFKLAKEINILLENKFGICEFSGVFFSLIRKL